MSQDSVTFKTKFLLSALPDVPFDGWTNALMERTAERLKTAKNKVDMEFPDGARDLVKYFSTWATDEAVKKLKKANLSDMRVRDRITCGVRTRLEILAPYKQAESAALSFMALPPQSFSLPKLVWDAADKLWWIAGDTATD